MSFIIVLVCIAISTGMAMYSMSRMALQNQKEMNLLLAARIHDRINSSMTEPIMVARTMSKNGFLYRFLAEDEAVAPEEDCINEMQSYLSDLKQGVGYDTAFVVSSTTNRYYTDIGLNKIVDPVNDEHDIWYSIFLEKNKEYDLDVDVDEVNDNVWTVFVNARLEKDGELLGVCGVGVQMTEIQALLAEYENEYDVKINLIDSNGLVQVDTDEFNIENAYLDDVPINTEDSAEYVYTAENGRFTVSKCIENLGWYLVVQKEGAGLDDDFRIILLQNGILFLIVVLAFFFANHVARRRTRVLEKRSYADSLTGIGNRSAYEEAIARLETDDPADDLVYINVDVNGLKEQNDNMGHAAGDELLKAAADCLETIFGKYGNIYRIGGDEFSAILHMTPQELSQAKADLEEYCANWHGQYVHEVSLSMGYVARYEVGSMPLDRMIREADRRMYDAKREYYNQAGHNRRRRSTDMPEGEGRRASDRRDGE
ncbi:MAG: diguanylate cyclase [Lachnospiraceae bacterium]|nr:diguanylate cyclase [Lachnospiraceae bacterium]